MSSTDRNDTSTPNGVSDAPGQVADGSTTWEWRRVKISTGAERPARKVAEGGRWRSLKRRNPREKLELRVSYRGGPEAWYEIRTRGKIGHFPGHAVLHDVMREINDGELFWTKRF